MDGGSDWGASHGVTALSIGGKPFDKGQFHPSLQHNYDGNWEHYRSLAVGRSSAYHPYRIVAKSVFTGKLEDVMSPSQDASWAEGRRVTALVWADLNRLFVGRNDGGGMRYAMLRHSGYSLSEYGSAWGSSRSVSALAAARSRC